MTPYLKQLHRRLDRARKHLEDFERQAARFINSIHHEVVTEKDSDGLNQLLRVKVKGGKEPPLRLSFIIGDCIHNLRSILDNLVWQLGNLSGCSPQTLEHIYFPVCETSVNFTTKLKLLNCLPQPAIDIIESLQPYQGGNDPHLHPLWILNRLWNDDKHRSPVICMTFHKSTGLSPSRWQSHRLPDGRLVQQLFLRGPMTIKAGGKFHDSKEIATVPLHAGEPEPQLNFRISFGIAFDEGGPAKGKPVAKCLRNLHDFVRDEVLTPFEPIFPK